MMRTRSKLVGVVVIAVLGALAAQMVQAANLITWSEADSLIDTTDYTGLAPFYWFANFGNTNAVTGAPMNQMEARKLPSWIHLETDPAFIGKDDSGLNDDATFNTGYSFTEPNSFSTGGQAGFSDLTLPDGASGRSGQAVDVTSGTGTTTSMLAIRILPGAPDSFRMWVVLDNGSGANFNVQSRLRVNLRDTDGPPLYPETANTRSEAEALPNGERLGNASNSAFTQNGVADAWAFLLSDVGTDDIVTIRPTSAGGIPGSYGAFAGLIITPEPSSVVLLVLGALGFGYAIRWRRRA